MSSLSNILSFIELQNLSVRQFEKECGLGNGTLNENKTRGVDLSSKNVEKISLKFHSQLKQAGYHIINVNPFGREDFVIINKEEMKKLIEERNRIAHGVEISGTVDYKGLYFEVAERERKALEEDKAYFKDLVKVNLTALVEQQLVIQSEVQAVHQWDAQLTASGDKEKEQDFLNHIQKLTADNLKKLRKKSKTV